MTKSLMKSSLGIFFYKFTFSESFKLAIDSLYKEPVRDERYVLMQVVNRDGNITSASTKLNVRISRQNEV